MSMLLSNLGLDICPVSMMKSVLSRQLGARRPAAHEFTSWPLSQMLAMPPIALDEQIRHLRHKNIMRLSRPLATGADIGVADAPARDVEMPPAPHQRKCYRRNVCIISATM